MGGAAGVGGWGRMEGMAPARILSTDGLSAPDVVPAWCDWMAQLFSGVDTVVETQPCFEGHLYVEPVGGLILTRLEAGQHRVSRSRQLRDAAGYFKIVAPWRGVALVRQHGRQATVRSGSWAIYDTNQPYEVLNPEWSEHLIIQLPRHGLLQRGLRLHGLMARTLSGAGMPQVALESMRSTYRELPAMSEPVAWRAAQMLVEVVYLALLELAGQSTVNSRQMVLRERIQAYVNSHLRDPALSLGLVADGLNCSKRHLHNAFADDTLGLQAWIQQRRLELAQQDLRQPHLRQLTITQIALDCGFHSSAHFSRVFKLQTGLSPSEFRARPGGASQSA